MMPLKKVKQQRLGENTCESYIQHKLVPRTYKEPLQYNNKKDNPI